MMKTSPTAIWPPATTSRRVDPFFPSMYTLDGNRGVWATRAACDRIAGRCRAVACRRVQRNFPQG